MLLKARGLVKWDMTLSCVTLKFTFQCSLCIFNSIPGAVTVWSWQMLCIFSKKMTSSFKVLSLQNLSIKTVVCCSLLNFKFNSSYVFLFLTLFPFFLKHLLIGTTTAAPTTTFFPSSTSPTWIVAIIVPCAIAIMLIPCWILLCVSIMMTEFKICIEMFGDDSYFLGGLKLFFLFTRMKMIVQCSLPLTQCLLCGCCARLRQRWHRRRSYNVQYTTRNSIF